MIKYILIALSVLTNTVLSGQNLRTEVKILDAQTRIPVPNAEISIGKESYLSDINGFFFFNHEAGTFFIGIKSHDFEEMKFEITIKSDTTLVLYYEKVVSIEEVRIIGSRNVGFKRDDNLEITKLTPADFSFLPGLGSNDDLLKELQLLPGVQSGGEGSSGLIIRGGQYDQNLLNLNGFPIYQPYHLFGLLSAIDPFMVSEIEIMKGGFPSKYGGKLSSVINFNTDKPVSDSVLSTVDAGILISGVATRFSPDTVTSISVSGRIGTTLPVNKTLNRLIPAFPFFNFYDFNLNASRKLNGKNNLSFTLFINNDYIKKSSSYTYFDQGIRSTFDNLVTSGWNDILAGMSWTNKPNENIKIQTNLFCQNFLSESTVEIHAIKYDVIKNTEDAINTNSSHIKELGFTNDLQLSFKKHNLNFGLFSYLRTVAPVVGTFLYTNGELNNDFLGSQNLDKENSQFEAGIYLEDQYYINDKTIFRPGLRISLLTNFKSVHFNPEPRLFISCKLTDNISLMGSYTVTTQSIHRISSSNAMVVNDLWIPSNSLIKPSKSYQSELGVFINTGKIFQTEVNLYYKTIKDLYIYKEGASFALYPLWEDNITVASGKSYGAEFLLQAHLNKTFILLAYTLSKTTRQSPEVNDGEIFNYKYDKPHDFNITIGYRPTNKLSFSCTWVIQNGNMISFYDRIIQADYYKYLPLPFMDKVNNIRFPLYHRLDLGLERKKSTKWGWKILKLDIYNMYSKLNPWYLTSDNGEIKQVALFPIIPSISYRIEF